MPAAAACRCTVHDALRGIRATGGAARYGSSKPANYPPTLEASHSSCAFRSTNSIATEKKEVFLLKDDFAMLSGRSILMIGDCFERRLVIMACSFFAGVNKSEELINFAGAENVASYACRIPVGCKHKGHSGCQGHVTLANIMLVGVGQPPWLNQAYSTQHGRLYYMSQELMARPAHESVPRMMRDFVQRFGPPSFVTLQSLSWDYGRWAMDASLEQCKPCDHWSAMLPPKTPVVGRNISVKVSETEALHYWATTGERFLKQWTRDAGQLASAVVEEVPKGTPVFWRTRYVPLLEAGMAPRALAHYYNTRPGGTPSTRATPILPHAYAAMNEAVRASHREWGVDLLDWARITSGFTGWYHADGLHQREWVSRIYLKVVLNAVLAALDERAIARCSA